MARAAHPTTMVVPRFAGGGAVERREAPVQEPGPGQLLLAVRANALRSSDRRRYLEGSPVTPGHEAAGVVVPAGPETSTPVGTPGVVYLMVYRGACRGCRAGATNQCLDRRGDLGFNLDGGLAPYELVTEPVFFPIGPDLPLADATMLRVVRDRPARTGRVGTDLPREEVRRVGSAFAPCGILSARDAGWSSGSSSGS